jgi:hypothetical protein
VSATETRVPVKPVVGAAGVAVLSPLADGEAAGAVVADAPGPPDIAEMGAVSVGFASVYDAPAAGAGDNASPVASGGGSDAAIIRAALAEVFAATPSADGSVAISPAFGVP